MADHTGGARPGTAMPDEPHDGECDGTSRADPASCAPRTSSDSDATPTITTAAAGAGGAGARGGGGAGAGSDSPRDAALADFYRRHHLMRVARALENLGVTTTSDLKHVGDAMLAKAGLRAPEKRKFKLAVEGLEISAQGRYTATVHTRGVAEDAGNYEGARRFLTATLEMRRKMHGGDNAAHPDIAASLHELGSLCSREGKYDDARRLFTQSLEMLRKVYGGDDAAHPDIAASLQELGNVCSREGRYDDARRFLTESLEMLRKVYGGEHPDIAATLQELGSLCYSEGRYDDARRFLTQSLEMRRKIYGGDDAVHPDIAVTLYQLGNVCSNEGNYEDAGRLLWRALELQRNVYGRGAAHPDIAASLHDLGCVYSNEGKYEDARRFLTETLEMRQKMHGGDNAAHPDIAASLHELGNVCSREGRYDDARRFLTESLEMLRKVYGGEHPDIAVTLYQLGNVCSNEGNYEDARRLLLRALELQRNVYGRGAAHPDIAASLHDLGCVGCIEGNYKDARRFLTQSLEMRRKIYGGDDAVHPDIAVSLHELGNVFYSEENYEDARRLHRQSLAMKRQAALAKPQRDRGDAAKPVTYASVGRRSASGSRDETARTWRPATQDTESATEALQWFDEMVAAGIKPDAATHTAVIQALSKVGRTTEALKFFGEMTAAGGRPDVVTYNSIIGALGKVGRTKEAVKLFDDMVVAGVKPDSKTFTSIINALGKAKRTEEALGWFDKMGAAGVQPNEVTYNTLINILGKVGRTEDALRWLDEMVGAGIKPSGVTYNTVINALGKNGRTEDALKWFDEMVSAGIKPNDVTYNTVINALVKAGRMEAALRWFDAMAEAGVKPNEVTYNTFINAFGNAGRTEEALNWFGKMMEVGPKPDGMTYATVIHAIESGPMHAVAANLANCGHLLESVRKDYAGAEIMYKRAIEADPTHAVALAYYRHLLENVRKDRSEASLDTASSQARSGHDGAKSSVLEEGRISSREAVPMVGGGAAGAALQAAEDMCEPAIDSDPTQQADVASSLVEWGCSSDGRRLYFNPSDRHDQADLGFSAGTLAQDAHGGDLMRAASEASGRQSEVRLPVSASAAVASIIQALGGKDCNYRVAPLCTRSGVFAWKLRAWVPSVATRARTGMATHPTAPHRQVQTRARTQAQRQEQEFTVTISIVRPHLKRQDVPSSTEARRALVSPDGRWVVTAGRHAAVWDMHGGVLRDGTEGGERYGCSEFPLVPPDGADATALAVSEDSRWIVAGYADGCVRLHALARLGEGTGEDADEGAAVEKPAAWAVAAIFTAHGGPVRAVDVSVACGKVLTCGVDLQSHVWDMAAAFAVAGPAPSSPTTTPAPVVMTLHHDQLPEAGCFITPATLTWAPRADPRAERGSPNKMKPATQPVVGTADALTSAPLSPQWQVAVASGSAVTVWSQGSSSSGGKPVEVRRLDGHGALRGPGCLAEWGGQKLVTSDAKTGAIRVWDLSGEGRCEARWSSRGTGSASSPGPCAVAVARGYVATMDADGAVRMWAPTAVPDKTAVPAAEGDDGSSPRVMERGYAFVHGVLPAAGRTGMAWGGTVAMTADAGTVVSCDAVRGVVISDALPDQSKREGVWQQPSRQPQGSQHGNTSGGGSGGGGAPPESVIVLTLNAGDRLDFRRFADWMRWRLGLCTQRTPPAALSAPESAVPAPPAPGVSATTAKTFPRTSAETCPRPTHQLHGAAADHPQLGFGPPTSAITTHPIDRAVVGMAASPPAGTPTYRGAASGSGGMGVVRMPGEFPGSGGSGIGGALAGPLSQPFGSAPNLVDIIAMGGMPAKMPSPTRGAMRSIATRGDTRKQHHGSTEPSMQVAVARTLVQATTAVGPPPLPSAERRERRRSSSDDTEDAASEEGDDPVFGLSSVSCGAVMQQGKDQDKALGPTGRRSRPLPRLDPSVWGTQGPLPLSARGWPSGISAPPAVPGEGTAVGEGGKAIDNDLILFMLREIVRHGITAEQQRHAARQLDHVFSVPANRSTVLRVVSIPLAPPKPLSTAAATTRPVPQHSPTMPGDQGASDETVAAAFDQVVNCVLGGAARAAVAGATSGGGAVTGDLEASRETRAILQRLAAARKGARTRTRAAQRIQRAWQACRWAPEMQSSRASDLPELHGLYIGGDETRSIGDDGTGKASGRMLRSMGAAARQGRVAIEGALWQWLALHKWTRYALAFAKNEMTLDLMRDVTDDELTHDFGVRDPAVRHLILDATSKLTP